MRHTLLSLALLLGLIAAASASPFTISFNGMDADYQGLDPGGGPWPYSGTVAFNSAFDSAQVVLATSPVGVYSDTLQWGGIDEDAARYYSSDLGELTLVGGNFNQTPITIESFLQLVDAIQLDYYDPARNPEGNFQTWLHVQPQQYAISAVPEPAAGPLLAIGALLAVFGWWRRGRQLRRRAAPPQWPEASATWLSLNSDDPVPGGGETEVSGESYRRLRC